VLRQPVGEKTWLRVLTVMVPPFVAPLDQVVITVSQ
jgi:hypothetical protein